MESPQNGLGQSRFNNSNLRRLTTEYETNPVSVLALPDKPEQEAVRVASRKADVDRESDLQKGAKEWQKLKEKAETARAAEREAQAEIDCAKWRQAELVAGLYGRWGKDGLTFQAIADRFDEPVSSIKLIVGMWNEFADREDLGERRFSDWQRIHNGVHSALAGVNRMVTDEGPRKKLEASVGERLPDEIGKIVGDKTLRTNRDLQVKTKAAVKRLVHLEHARLFPAPRMAGDPIRLMDGVDLLASQDDRSVSCIILDAPYGTSANPRGLQMANNTPEEARDLLIKLAPIVPRMLTVNGFVFWFRPGFRIDTTDHLKPILAEHFEMRQLVWWKTSAGLSPEGKNYGACHELIFLLWPKGRSQPVPHVYLPDCLRISHDEMSGANSPHPSAKPVRLFEQLIEATTMPGDLVLDPFAGTGAAVEAALKLERRVVAAESVPKVLQLAKQRLTECLADLGNDPVTAAFAAERGIEVV